MADALLGADEKGKANMTQVLGRDKLVQNLARYAENLKNALVTQAEIMQSKVVDFAKVHHPYKDHTGHLTQSIQPGTITLEKKGNIRAVIEVRQPYASYVEFGTSRSKPYPFLVPALIGNQGEFRRRITEAFRGARP